MSSATLDPSTPVLVGVGQASERLGDDDYAARSPLELTVAAARSALADAGLPAGEVDVVAAVRAFDASHPLVRPPLGQPDNPPRAVAQAIGADPARAILAVTGGQSPQALVTEMAGDIAAGRHRAALVVAGEAISTALHLQSTGASTSWAREVGGTLEDRGYDLGGVVGLQMVAHGLVSPPAMYALAQQARRRRLGQTAAAMREEMGALFAPFSRVAAANPHAASPRERTPEALVTVDERNRMVADPLTLELTSREKVNQAAAVLLTSVEVARAAGISEDRWVFLHGHADLAEKAVLARPDLGASPAAAAAVTIALEVAGIGADDLTAMDLYSCFPIAVQAVTDAVGIAPDDPRGLTLTGGLPYFGGAGNGYSLHAIAEAVDRCRAEPGARVLVGANGGTLSKYAAGVYATTPREWSPGLDAIAQARLDAVEDVSVALHPDGDATIEAYTVLPAADGADKGVVVGRLLASGRRFIAGTAGPEALALLGEESVFTTTVHARAFGWGNRVAVSAAAMEARHPRRPAVLGADHTHALVRRDGHVLEVTINRPAARNALTPDANAELEAIFDAYFADDDLWVAILTGAGDQAFSAGNDLAHTASGKPIWTPPTGFAGLTSRRHLSKPVIAAVNGYALGGGFEIALACHLVVADRTATFGLPEVRVGLIAAAGGLVRLPRALPEKLANELILTGRRATAEELAAHGVVTRIAEDGEVMAVARDLAAEIISRSPTSVRHSLRAMAAGREVADVVDAIEAGQPALDDLLMTDDLHEGVQAFAGKREPRWRNR